jgi:hypothetical protein
MFQFQFANVNGQWGPYCQQMKTKAVAGDSINAAIYWAEKYHNTALHVEQLIPLAAHMIVSAKGLNSATISGLDIVRCDDSGIRRLSDESTEKLQRTSEEWDLNTRSLFLNHQQEYLYTP